MISEEILFLKDEQLTVVTDAATLSQALQKRVDSWIVSRGEIFFPCAPALLESYMQRLETLFALLGKPWSKEELERLAQVLDRRLQEGFRASPHSRVVVRYESENYPTSPSMRLSVNISSIVETIEQQYKKWTQMREPPLFGTHPDAKVMAVIGELGEPSRVPILDVGAGTGRNTLPLARMGYPVQAVELSPAFVQQLNSSVNAQGLPVMVTAGNVIDPKVQLPQANYALAIAAEVVSHFRSLDEFRQFLVRMSDVLRPGGLLLFNSFIASDGYEPDRLAREISELAWSSLFTRADLATVLDGLPLELISDESAYEYERQHLPAEAWPPTGWFEHWATGQDLFLIENAPMQLRWFLYRRK